MFKIRFTYPIKFLLQFVVLLSINSVSFSQSLSDSFALVDSYNKIAFDTKKSNIVKSISALNKAENIAKIIKYKKGEAISYMYEAGIYQQQGFTKRALSVFYNSLNIFRSINDTFHIAKVNQLIALSLLAEEKYDSAIIVYTKSLAVYTKLNTKEEIVNVNNSIGMIYVKMNQINTAITFFNKALSDSKLIGYLYGEKKAYYHLGVAEQKRNNFAIAVNYFQQSLNIDQKINDQFGIALNKLSLVGILITEKKLKEAELQGLSAYTKASSIEAYDLQDSLVKQLIKIFMLTGNTSKIIAWQDSAIVVIKKQRQKENEYAANFIEIIKSQQEQRIENEKAILRAERVSNEQFYILTVGTFILIILAALVIIVFLSFQKQKQLSTELRAKNSLIEEQIVELGMLNKEISEQNILLEIDNKTKDKLLSIISHDLRNPLVNTKGILNLVNQDMVPADEAKILLLQLETQYMSSTSLLDNLLFWLKGQMLGKDVEKMKLPIIGIVKGLVEEHKLLLKRKNINFNNMIDDDLLVNTDKEMIRIVLRNLISNSIKFTPQNGTIYIIGKHFNEETKIIVQDSGIGMTAETIQKILSKQYYTTAGTALEKGSGFGLMLCSDLINRLGGKLSIESEFGKGSVFTITLHD